MEKKNLSPTTIDYDLRSHHKSLICLLDQLTSFYIMGILVLNGVNSMIVDISNGRVHERMTKYMQEKLF